MAIKPIAEEVITEGQFRDAYFPNCLDHDAVLRFIDSRIDDVDAETQLRTGANYLITDALVQALLHKAEIYLVSARLWQTIKAVMDGYDAEELPPEYVEPEQAAANRDFYLAQANEILTRYDGDPQASASQFIGAMESGGIEEGTPGVLGIIY